MMQVSLFKSNKHWNSFVPHCICVKLSLHSIYSRNCWISQHDATWPQLHLWWFAGTFPLVHFVVVNLAWSFDIQYHFLPYTLFVHLTGILLPGQIACILVWCWVVFQPKLCKFWMWWTLHFCVWGKTLLEKKSDCLSRLQYICIHWQRQLVFYPDQNEQDLGVVLP